MRSATKAQTERRNAILDGIRKAGIATPAALRRYLAGRAHIHVTVDTVGRDLRAMEDDGIVVRQPHPTAGHTWGNGRRIVHTGWSIGPSEQAGPIRV